MRDRERKKLDKFERQAAFFSDNAADFPAGTPGGAVAAANAAIVAEMQQLDAAQFSTTGARRQATNDKEDLFDDLMPLLKNMNRAANAFDDDIPGTEQMFRMPRNRSETALLAAARAFRADAEPLKTNFIEYGLPDTFLADLQELIDDIAAAGTRGDSSGEHRTASTAGLTDAAQRGMATSRRADSVVRIKFSNDAQKLAAWDTASHLQRAAKKKSGDGGGTTPNP